MNDGGWIGLASLAVTGLLGVLTLLVNRRYDQKTADLKAQNEQQAAQLAVQAARIAECEKKHAGAESLLEATRRDLAARDARDKADLQKQIDDLKSQIARKKDKTDGHGPLP